MGTFYINGNIVDNGQEWDSDVSPKMLKEFIDGLQDGEDIELDITSFGGSCTAGNAMVSMLRNASANGHHTRAHIISIAASMASVLACACEELVIDSNAFLMVHLPWSTVEGNYTTMRKEADTLELFTKSLVSIYRSKFNLSDEDIVRLLEDETWILGSEAENYGLKCSINQVDGELKVAAKCKYDYRNLPRGFTMNKNIEEEMKPVEANSIPLSEADEPETKEVVAVEEEAEKVGDEVLEETTKEEETNEETSTEETKEEETNEEPEEDEEVLNKDEVLAKFAEYEKQIEELIQENEELKNKLAECEKPVEEDGSEEQNEEMVSKDECEKRVSGMQSKMQAKINDFTSQLKVKDEELNKVRAELTSLNQRLEEANGELSAVASALEEKNNALAQLNAGVLRPAEELPTMKDGLAKCATPKERVDFLKSGKYVR